MILPKQETAPEDVPAWFIILIVGLIVVIGAFAIEMAYMPPYWLHTVIWLPVTLLLAIFPLRPPKSPMIACQYQTDARVGRAS